MKPNNLLLLIIVFLSAGCTSRSADKPARPIAGLDHVLIVSIDGLRPDRLLLADTPVMHELVRQGTYTFWARTTAVSITLPSHTSMLTGVTPNKHGIGWNTTLPQVIYPSVPTLFELAKKAGYSTGMAAGKKKFNTLNKPGTVDWAFIPEEDKTDDNAVADEAVKIIRNHQPDVMFVHFPDTDTAGHAHGWGSFEQSVAIANADRALGRVLAALEAAGRRASTAVIVTADHGGQGRTHGPDDPRSRHIPWILTGPGVKKAYDLTQRADLVVNTEDTCATACWVLGIPRPPNFDGRPVTDAFVGVGRDGETVR